MSKRSLSEISAEADAGYLKDHLPVKAESHADREHALLSPSNFNRILNCPAHLHLIQDLPEDTPSEYALFGTETHEYGAEALKLALKGKSYSTILNKIKDNNQRYLVEDWANHCLSTYTKAVKFSDKKPKVLIEERVKFTDNIWGTLDFGLIFSRGAADFTAISDLKTGFTPHSAAESEQLRIYNLAVIETHELKNVEKSYLSIFQPAVYEEPDKVILSKEEIDEFRELALDTEAKALGILKRGPKKEDFKVGDHCKFCRARAAMICPAWNKRFDETAPVKIGKTSTLPDVKSLPIEKMVQVFSHKQLIESWLSDVEHELMSLVLAGKKVGLKLVESRSRSSWLEDEKKVAAELKKLGVKEPWRQELITITEAKRIARKPIDKLIQKNKPKLQLAVLDDKRPAADLGKKESLQMLTELDTDDTDVTKLTNTRSRRSSKAGGRGNSRGAKNGKATADTKRTRTNGRAKGKRRS